MALTKLQAARQLRVSEAHVQAAIERGLLQVDSNGDIRTIDDLRRSDALLSIFSRLRKTVDAEAQAAAEQLRLRRQHEDQLFRDLRLAKIEGRMGRMSELVEELSEIRGTYQNENEVSEND